MSQAIGSRAQVLSGTADHTSGGLRSSDLVRGADGRIKSKAQVAAGKSNPGLKKWRTAVNKAKKKLDIPKKGEFTPITGALLTEARKAFKKTK